MRRVSDFKVEGWKKKQRLKRTWEKQDEENGV